MSRRAKISRDFTNQVLLVVWASTAGASVANSVLAKVVCSFELFIADLTRKCRIFSSHVVSVWREWMERIPLIEIQTFTRHPSGILRRSLPSVNILEETIYIIHNASPAFFNLKLRYACAWLFSQCPSLE